MVGIEIQATDSAASARGNGQLREGGIVHLEDVYTTEMRDETHSYLRKQGAKLGIDRAD